MASVNSVVKSIGIPATCEILDGYLGDIRAFSVHQEGSFFVMDGGLLPTKNRKTLTDYYGDATRIVVPKSVERLGKRCFIWRERLLLFEESSCLRHIGRHVFRHSGIESIDIPVSYKRFKGSLTGLKSVRIDANNVFRVS
jgi:hypothetical protein